MDELRDAAQAIAEALGQLSVVASARRHGEELARVVVDAQAAGLERLVELATDPSVLEGDPELAEVLWVHRPFRGDPTMLAELPERVDALLASIAQTGVPGLVEAAEGMLEDLAELYGWALCRAIELLHESGDSAAVRGALDDPLVASLLLAHGLHPDPLEVRVGRALQALAATLGEHGSRAQLQEVTAEGVVRIEIVGGDPRQAWRSRLAVERALTSALPDAAAVEVSGAGVEPTVERGETAFIPIGSIRRRQASPSPGPSRWIEVPELADLADLEVRRLSCDGVGLVACRVGRDYFVTIDTFVTVDTVDTLGSSLAGLRLVSLDPPVVEDAHGHRVVFSNPLPTHVSDLGVEVSVP
ncbi:MAG: hypothetical protein QOJ19_1572 [Acidimicrobiia bacterium]|nr:hypothetical protein [Acidimicrobiia bacterium]